MTNTTPYSLKGTLLGACSCDWGCPCNFEMPPSRGFCEGCYLWHVEKGSYGQVQLDGLNFAGLIRSPQAIHLGNLTTLYLVDEKADTRQRQALDVMFSPDQNVVPFSIFRMLTGTFLGTRYVPFHIDFQGIRSRASVPGMLDLQLTPMKNPVTGEDELAKLLKPTGFTSKEQDLCTSATFRLTGEGLSYDHSGRYAEYSRFEYGTQG